MKNKATAISDRIRRLRQEHNLSQADLGEKVGVHQKQISSYERGINVPSTEVLIKMAETFNVTLDYLAFAAEGQQANINVQDRELLRRFEAVDQLTDDERDLAKRILDLVILKNKFQSLAGQAA